MEGNIFDAASKPLSGPGFITDNLMYLAKEFGVAVPELNLSAAEHESIKIRSAYAHAAGIIRHAKRSQLVTDKLVEYGWSEEVIKRLGIGTVESYKSYIKTLTEKFGYDLEFLMSIDLAGRDNKSGTGGTHKQHPLFQPWNLIYTIKDSGGSPVGFSARNLKYEEQKEDFEAGRSEYCARKYINTRTTSIFEKGKHLFNFNEAKQSPHKTAVIFEGNADAVTAYAGGLKTATATLGTELSDEHIQLLLVNGIKRLVLCMDPDKAGKKATDRITQMLEKYEDGSVLKVEILVMPEGQDPDQFIRGFGDLREGVKALQKMTRIGLDAWNTQRRIIEGADPVEICEKQLPLIMMTEESFIRRANLADQLAESTGIAKVFVRRELERLCRAEALRAKLEEAMCAMEEAEQQIEAIHSQLEEV